MKFRLFAVMLIALGLVNCSTPGKNEHDHDNGDSDSTAANEALYNEVMKIHDEVMPKMETIYNLKKRLQERIANTPGMVVEEKEKLQKRISNLDSVGQMMMTWMHEFSPVADTVSQEKAREYLESEMERVKKVREAMLEILEKEKGKN